MHPPADLPTPGACDMTPDVVPSLRLLTSNMDPPETLVDLAPELLQLVLAHLAPHDLVRFGQTCRRAHDFIRPAANQHLWESVFTNTFDHPKHAWCRLAPTARRDHQPREALWDWHRELVRRTHVFNLLVRGDRPQIARQLEHVVTTLLDVQQTASTSLNTDYLHHLEQTVGGFDHIVHDFSNHPHSLAVPQPSETIHQRPVTRSMLRRSAVAPEWASRFHIIHGPTRREEESPSSKAGARALVYDWTSTGEEADFGPFYKDCSGKVNWQLLEAISSLMHRIFATALEGYHLRPTGYDLHVPLGQPMHSAIPNDWAGVTGTWVGTYAFLDYRALVHYNFAHTLEHHLGLEDCEEACGDMMRLDLELDDSDELSRDPRLQSSLPTCDDLPKLFFRGSSTAQATERPAIQVRGMTCLAYGGREVRWRLIIR